MRHRYGASGTFVNTGLLRDHVSTLQEERKTALQLRESLIAMRNNCDSADFSSFTPVLRNVNQLIEYLERMARFLAETEEKVIVISRETARQIEDQSLHIGHVSSSTFML